MTSSAVRAASRSSRRDRASGGDRGSLSPALALFFAAGIAAVLYGVIEVAIPATLVAMDSPKLTGPTLSIWAVGALCGSILFVRISHRFDAETTLLGSLVLLGATHMLVPLAQSPAALAAALFIAGLPGAPCTAAISELIARRVVPSRRVEAFAWVTTAMGAGIAVGMAAGGSLSEVAGPGVTIMIGAITPLLAGVLVMRDRPRSDVVRGVAAARPLELRTARADVEQRTVEALRPTQECA